MNSQEFQTELANTWTFVEKVNEQFGFVQNPNIEVNEGVAMGLARNNLIYGKRFCSCFMVIGKTKEEQETAENRVCPCKIALEVEIPQSGSCHCGIFCTPQYAQQQTSKEETESVTRTHSQGITKGQAEALLKEEQLDSDELETLIEARTLGMVHFILMDVREYMEYQMEHIVGTDALVPTSQFYAKIEEHHNDKQTPIIVYCFSGSRSHQVQHVMKSMGFVHVCNLRSGIMTYNGAIKAGE